MPIHVYVVKDWDRYPLLLSMQKFLEGATSLYLKEVIIGTLATNVALHWSQMAHKLVSFTAGGMPVFQGVWIGMNVHVQKNNTPFMSRIHCMAHNTNMPIQTLSKVAIVSKIENTLQHMYPTFLTH